MKSKKENEKFKFNFLILIIIVLIVIMINIIVLLNKFLFPKQQEEYAKAENIVSQNTTNTTNINDQANTSDEAIIKKLKAGTERDRMEYYIGQYITYIEYGDYEKAYNLLYEEFKKNYFPTIEEFKKYVQKTYPEVIGVNYDDIDRQGKIYVLSLQITDPMDGAESKTQRFVIQENDYNNYVLSFQVI